MKFKLLILRINADPNSRNCILTTTILVLMRVQLKVNILNRGMRILPLLYKLIILENFLFNILKDAC